MERECWERAWGWVNDAISQRPTSAHCPGTLTANHSERINYFLGSLFPPSLSTAACHPIKTSFTKALRGTVAPHDLAEAPDAPEQVDGDKRFPLWNPAEWNQGDEWKYNQSPENDPLAPHHVKLQDLGLDEESDTDESVESYHIGGRHLTHARRVDDSDSDLDVPSEKEQTQLAEYEGNGWDGYEWDGYTYGADGWDGYTYGADGWDGETYGAGDDLDGELLDDASGLDGEPCC